MNLVHINPNNPNKGLQQHEVVSSCCGARILPHSDVCNFCHEPADEMLLKDFISAQEKRTDGIQLIPGGGWVDLNPSKEAKDEDRSGDYASDREDRRNEINN